MFLHERSGLTQRAPDGWDSARFQVFSLAQADSVKIALSYLSSRR
jgi:hypothetical protein